MKEVAMILDLDFIRSQYPVFTNPKTAGWAMFENAGGSYVPTQVIKRLNDFFQFTKVQPYGPFESSIAAGEAMDEGYQAIAELIDCDSAELTLGPSTSMNTYVLAQAVRPTLRPGDEVVVTNQDHEANIGCWRRLAEFGAIVREWRIDPQSGELSLADLATLLNAKTRLVCFPLCSNIVGSMNDYKTICDMAHDVGALTVGDGVSYAPHQVLNSGASGLDIYLFSTYKTFGPHLGVMWCRGNVMDTLEPQGHYFNRGIPHYNFNPAGPLHAEIAAAAGIAAYIDAVYDHHFTETGPNLHARALKVFGLFGEHETRQANRILEAIAAVPGSRIIGHKQAQAGFRAATISFTVEGMTSREVVKRLTVRKIAVRNGDFYAVRCLEGLGIKDTEDGVVRISLVHYNSVGDVDRLVEALGDL
ncbi:MAG: aminotransferase class V-fold PLP-dependent enzyme [Deltaproteobacteria bacterium]|nr:aminotransferase class V-fold PLP-dependent enzyme [Deltaproteobacteria bacterium]